MKNFNALFILSVLLLSASLSWLRAQLPQGLSGKLTGKKIAYAYQEGSKLKAIFTGQNAKQLTGSQVLISGFEMKTFRNGNTNELELVVQAPECLMDPNASVASSPGRLKAYTATTNLYIEGEGFFCRQTNAILIISNKVETIIRKEFLKSRSTNETPDLVSSSTATNQVLKIFSDHFQFLYESNLITYTGNVRVDDAQMELTCDVLNIFLTTNKTVQRITAENNVTIVNKQENSRATGERAVYVIEPNRETVELIGHPTWSDGRRTGKADLFTFDRKSNVFRAETNAVFKLPREQIGQPGLLSSGMLSTNVPTGKFVEIAAESIAFKLPETNSPGREIVAENNVVIASESDQSRATAGKAVYNEATGIVELTGKPIWKIRESEIKAEVLAIGRTNQFFSARTNVYIKLPANVFEKTLKSGATTNASTTTNRWVEIFCDNFLYATDVVRLNENVRANLLDENGSLTTLLCGFAKISLGPSNQVETVRAEKNVVLQEIPGELLQTNLLKKTVTCEALTLNRSIKTGLLESVHAETDVVSEQVENTRSGQTLKRVSADDVNIIFSQTTNQIQSVVAEGNVLAEKIERVGTTNNAVQAKGEKAVYQFSGEQEYVELTGEPSAWTDSILLSEAKIVRWNLKTGKLGAIPYKVTPLNSTNTINALRIPKRP